LRFRLCDPAYPDKCVEVTVPREVVLRARSIHEVVDYIQHELCERYRVFAFRQFRMKAEPPAIEAMVEEYCRKIRILILKWVIEAVKWGRVERRAA